MHSFHAEKSLFLHWSRIANPARARTRAHALARVVYTGNTRARAREKTFAGKKFRRQWRHEPSLWTIHFFFMEN